MRIQGLGPQNVTEVEGSKKAEPIGPAPRAATVGSVKVATGAQRIVNAVARDEKASAEKVASLRQAVQSGTYKVDYDKLAERIADEDPARVCTHEE